MLLAVEVVSVYVWTSHKGPFIEIAVSDEYAEPRAWRQHRSVCEGIDPEGVKSLGICGIMSLESENNQREIQALENPAQKRGEGMPVSKGENYD